MTVTIRPAQGEELEALIETSRREYAADIIENAGLDEAAARRKAEADFETALQLPAQQFYAVEEDGAVVGRLWLAERQLDGREALYVYDITIDQEHRGRGLGRATMELVEQEARTRGVARVDLNVFGGNEVARALYRSLDYEEIAVYMRKRLG